MRIWDVRKKVKVGLIRSKILTDLDCRNLVIYLCGILFLGLLYFMSMRFLWDFSIDNVVQQTLLILLLASPVEIVFGFLVKNRVGLLEKLQFIILAFHLGTAVSAVAISFAGFIMMNNANLLILRGLLFIILSAVVLLDWIMGKATAIKVKEIPLKDEIFMLLIYTVLVTRGILFIHQVGYNSGGIVDATFAVFSSLVITSIFFMVALYFNSMYVLFIKRGFKFFLVVSGVLSVCLGSFLSVFVGLGTSDSSNLSPFELVLYNFLEVATLDLSVIRIILFEGILMVSVVFIVHNLFQMDYVSLQFHKVSLKRKRNRLER